MNNLGSHKMKHDVVSLCVLVKKNRCLGDYVV